MPLAQHKHHRDTRTPGAPVGEQGSGQSVFLRRDRLSRPGMLTLLLRSLPAGGLACTFSFCIKLCRWHLAKPAATAATGREGMGPQPAARRDVNRSPPATPLMGPIYCWSWPWPASSPQERVPFTPVWEPRLLWWPAPTGQWAVLLGHECALLPRWGSSSVMLTLGTCFK